MQTSLIICSRNRAELLLDTVNSILAGETVPDELVIVDQSDMYNSFLAELHHSNNCHIRYISSHSIGLCKARNYGIAVSSHEILAFIDDDMRVTPDWFSVLIGALVSAGPIAAVTGKVLPGNPEIIGGFAPSIATNNEFQVYSGRIGKDVLAAGNMAMYRETIHAIGSFDERLGVGANFPAADDNDYGLRLLESGFQIIYVPKAIIYHRAWRNPKDYFSIRWSYGRGKGGFYLKHLSLKDPYILRRMVWDIVLRWIRFPWRVFHRPRLAAGDLVYTLGILSGAIEWIWTGQRREALVTTT